MLSKWYKTVSAEAPLEQGDILFGCPSIEIPADVTPNEVRDNPTVVIDAVLRDYVIVTQSCDLEDGNVEFVQLCPVHELGGLPDLSSRSKRGELAKDRMPRFTLLDKNNRQGFPQDYLVVDLASVQSLRLGYVKQVAIASRRLRLVSPYREYLAQRFAYYFMRVGKPSPVAPFPDL